MNWSWKSSLRIRLLLLAVVALAFVLMYFHVNLYWGLLFLPVALFLVIAAVMGGIYDE